MYIQYCNYTLQPHQCCATPTHTAAIYTINQSIMVNQHSTRQHSLGFSTMECIYNIATTRCSHTNVVPHQLTQLQYIQSINQLWLISMVCDSTVWVFPPWNVYTILQLHAATTPMLCHTNSHSCNIYNQSINNG